MGFPEPEVKHCLQVAQGNPDLAVEFLTNGIPEGLTAVAAPSSTTTGTPPLQALRQHPQFHDLRRLVQNNPAMLQQVLTQIGQQDPELLREINANQAAFLELMNTEPVDVRSGSSSTAASTTTAPSRSGPPSSPAEMAALLQNMDPAELEQMAHVMGLAPEQLRQTAQLMGQLPPQEQQTIELTPDELAAVDRLAELGFDRTEAAQAFLACDKNEALAANFLMDSSMGDGGGFGDNQHDNNDNDDDMYD